jgi:hypothetical protein
MEGVVENNKNIDENEKHHYHDKIVEKYGECQYIPGHFANGKERNPIWIVNENGKELLLMYCEPGAICILCHKSYQKLSDFEREKNDNKRMCFSQKTDTKYIRNSSSLYIHQIIMNWYGNGSGTSNLSVDHIDRNPLNNTFENLRIATGEEQRANATGNIPDTKKGRQHHARDLPEGIAHEDMPRYVNYNVNHYGKNKEFSREFFRIENHPTLNGKVWSSTTKHSVSIQEKLNEAKHTLALLDQGILPELKERPLPNLVTTYPERDTYIMAWQKRLIDKTLTKKMTIKENYYEMEEEDQKNILEKLNREVIKKYGSEYSFLDIPENEIIEIQEEIEEENKTKLPKYVRTQLFGEDLYLVFNKDDHQHRRMTSTTKLPNNYNINRELYNLNQKIIEKYGEQNALSLEQFPFNPEEQRTITLPPNMYISLKCKTPYLIMQDGNDTYSLILPEKYDLEHQLTLFQECKQKDPIQSMDANKEWLYSGFRPDNISICLKENKYYQLQYKSKTTEYRHDKSKTLPKKDFNMNIELINFNVCISEKYGEEFAFLQKIIKL